MAPRSHHRLSEYRRKRDFTKTDEPAGGKASVTTRGRALRFVIQKHEASQLHFDFRLELDGAMKSWAAPKGPSLDPTVKRLAMQVEDHPIEYNKFEGTIPEGQYGGGTVMLWDRGTYASDEGGVEGLRKGLKSGKIAFTLRGERLQGSWALVRIARGDGRQWLLIKHRDEFAKARGDIVARETTSVTTGRTMAKIRDGAKASARPARTTRPARTARGGKQARVSFSLTPMLAAVGAEIPKGDGWTFEPKYDGVRVLAFVEGDEVNLVTRNRIDRAAQFPEVVDALRGLSRRRRRPFVLDGELVARRGSELGRFQELQSRVHETGAEAITERATGAPAVLVAFDLLLDGDVTLVEEPWTVRRTSLEKLLRGKLEAGLQLGESTIDEGAALLVKAKRAGWEGIMAKRTDAAYALGVRSRQWLKLKLEAQQEFVVGGWTEPRNSRQHIGALLLGHWRRGKLIYAGHTGGGFSRSSLADMYKRLVPLERRACPFDETPVTNETAHWTKPEVVVEVKFNEWTEEGRLRQPIFLGIRDDKEAREVRREESSMQSRRRTVRPAIGGSGRMKKAATPRRGALDVVAQLSTIEAKGGDGAVVIARGRSLDVTNLDKIYFPKAGYTKGGYTKGDVMRYYATVAPVLLPLIADRPLVLRRFPNGVAAPAFFQQNAPADAPDGVRTAQVEADDEDGKASRIVAGDLTTLLYGVQLGAIELNPWHSRVKSIASADYTILDLDPGPKATFPKIVQLARWIGDVLTELKLSSAVKTSGSRGIHIYIPLPARTPFALGQDIAQWIATRVAEAHPKEATVVRSIRGRPPAAIYVDYLQNAEGKSVASAFSVRAREPATVSTPLAWAEVRAGLDPAAFTIETVPRQLAKRAKIWTEAMSKKNSLVTLSKLLR